MSKVSEGVKAKALRLIGCSPRFNHFPPFTSVQTGSEAAIFMFPDGALPASSAHGEALWTHVVDFRCRGAAALPLQDGPMDRWTSGDVFGAARTWRMFCDCLGHHQRDQHWSRGAGSPEFIRQHLQKGNETQQHFLWGGARCM
ncbi:unnamed protein product [Cladocopium goreaui]|uniref:Uncharacterized protein n=1 Tax=Cladocopium goreaui TaxID=2562237 RepID=A0A9P1CJ74_9DINO|nr:unnamed protein product [Cladocopium goreaui]